MNSKEYTIIMNFRKNITDQNQEKINESLKQLELLANQKNKYAIHELAYAYEHGIAYEKNIKKACNLYIFSGELGNIKSFYNAAKIFHKLGEYETAKRFYEKAIYSPLAYYELALMYLKGKVGSASKNKAKIYLEKSSQLGCKEADYLLAEIYINERNKVNCYKKASYYLNRALRKGVEDKYNLKNRINELINEDKEEITN